MIIYDAKYLNFKDTLCCGQVFRFYPTENGYFLVAGNNMAKVYNSDDKAYIVADNEDFFRKYFDLEKDYSKIVESVNACNIQKVIMCADRYSGIRILRQNKEEAFFSFIVSQNNNIPRIKSIIEKLCTHFGEKHTFMEKEYYGFPTANVLAAADLSELKEVGLGYRAEYIKNAAQSIVNGDIDFDELDKLATVDLKIALLKIKGVGDKVANCVTLFGFNRSDSFPVDTWIEKIYREDFNGTLTDRVKINRYFLDLFKENSGYVQQYLFYAKREGLI